MGPEIERQGRYQVFKKEKAKYKRHIKQARNMGWRKFCSAASHPYGKQYKAAFRKSVFPSQIPYLINGNPKGSLQEAAQNILDQIFLSPAIPPNFNLTTSTQPPDPPFSPPRNLGGNILLFQKGGKDQWLSSSYRPVSLLPTIGKVLEKLLTQRLTYHLESTNSLNDRLHGFREGKSVDTAINELLRKIKTARRDGNLLQNRKVTLLTPQGRATTDQKQGCPQGSCSGPALFNLVANEILNQVWPDNVHIQSFADDFVLIIKADTNRIPVEDTQSAITQFSSWCSEN
ncbi:hypothetical protein AVEN_163876-1 [Araneus ventricosus]|uniref:Reverse transcriptase domain-containing protein n=1 Tax=Araneus ventricosus TaxID=182803 RepID=A0A4Y2H5B7_ARAVE|nr:hypothetical protein AVEN_163876-1 [Araneus ventricosus]